MELKVIIAKNRLMWVTSMLEKSDCTSKQIYDEFVRLKLEPGVNIDRISHAIRDAETHISGWKLGEKNGRASFAAIYRLGPGVNAPRPKKMRERERVEKSKDPLPIKRSGAVVRVREYRDLPMDFFRRAA